MRIQCSLAWRYLKGRKLRTALTTLAVVFGVFVFFAMNLILPTVTRAMFISVEAANGVSDFTVVSASGGSFAGVDGAALERVEGVRAASPLFSLVIDFPADFIDNDPQKPDVARKVLLTGILPAEARALRAFPLEEGRFLDEADAAGALVTQTFADTLGAKLGSAFRLPGANGSVELNIVGIMPPDIGSPAEEVVVTLELARLIADEPGKLSAVAIGIDDPTAGESERARIRADIETLVGPGLKIDDALSGKEAFATIELASTVMNVFGILALFMGGFIIFNTFRAVVAERRRDLGMLRALGASRASVMGVILAEGLMQGFIGSLAGMLLGYAVVSGVLALLGPILARFVSMELGAPVATVGTMLKSLALGLGTSILAALYPALGASRVTPIEALRPQASESGYSRKAAGFLIAGYLLIAASILAVFTGKPALIVPGGFVFLAGLALASPGLVGPFAFIAGKVSGLFSKRSGSGGYSRGTGVIARGTGVIARGHLARQPSRAAATASSTMIGLAVIVAAGGMLSSLVVPLKDMFQKSLGSDYLLIPPSVMLWNGDVGAGQGLAESLRAIEGVSDVSTMRYAPSASGGQPVSMIGIDPASFPRVSGLRFMEGNASAYGKIERGRSLIANGVFLTVTGAKVGGIVRLASLSGDVEYRVEALATDMLNMKAAAAFLSQENLASDFGGAKDVFIQLDLKPGTDADNADAAIRAASAPYPQFLLVKGKAYLESMMELLWAGFAGIFVLFGILSLPSLIATVNTLCIGVIERTREIGMVRAVGASRKQIRAMVLSEALLLAGIGTVLGITGGAYLSGSLVSALTGIFPLGWALPLAGFAAAAFFGIAFGALASLVPARQAAGLEIVEALRYE